MGAWTGTRAAAWCRSGVTHARPTATALAAIAAVAVATGCSARSRPARVEPEAPPRPGYQLPTAPPPPPWQLQCKTLAPGSTGGGAAVKTLDFEDDPLPPLARGPRIEERPRTGWARTPAQLRDAVARRRADLEACWKWAQVDGGLAATHLDVTLRIDPWGQVDDVAAASDRPEDAALGACVEAALAATAVDAIRTRWTVGHVGLDFVLAAQPPWPAPPPRPTASAAAPRRYGGRLCTPVLVDADPDPLTLATALTLSDRDPSREPRRGRAPQLRIGCAVVVDDGLTIPVVRAAVRANLAGFGACHAAAHARDPALTGVVTLHLVFGAGSSVPAQVRVDGAGDDALHACMATAAGALWLPPGPTSTLVVNYPFALVPAPAARADETDPHRDAVALLEAGDIDAALARWARLLRDDPDAEGSCAWRAGVLRAMAAQAPWLDDPRVERALDDLLAQVAPMRDRDRARACLAPALPVIDAMRGRRAAGPLAFDLRWRESLDLLTRLLPVADLLPDGDDVRLGHAIALSMTDVDAAIAELDALVGDGDPGYPGELAAQLRRDRELLHDPCGL
ncbi:MAG: hypothetical protein H6708_04625 [Kofleriaceae bacterium]|nr:hypothetical protein [Kofleriaceae bacterium]